MISQAARARQAPRPRPATPLPACRWISAQSSPLPCSKRVTGVATVEAMDELYRDQILEHYKRPHHFGRLDEYDLEFEDSNPFCGDEQHVFLKLDDDGRVTEIAFQGQGCAIST